LRPHTKQAPGLIPKFFLAAAIAAAMAGAAKRKTGTRLDTEVSHFALLHLPKPVVVNVMLAVLLGKAAFDFAKPHGQVWELLPEYTVHKPLKL
jgi:hypothetical protein